MSDIDLGDIAATGAFLVAIVAAVIAGLSKRQARRSADASERSAAAAEESAASSQRSADAAEAQTRLAEDQDSRYDPVWETAKGSGGTMTVLRRTVINRTREHAYQVRVSGSGVTPVGSEQVLDGEGLTFDYRPPRDPRERSKPTEVVVQWQRPPYRGSVDQEWRGDLSVL